MQHIAILDFGSQYTHLISRRIRESGVASRIYPHNILARELKTGEAAGIIISGGPQSVWAKNHLSCDREIFDLGLPILGLCFGHQLIAQMLGGKVKSGKTHEYGSAKLKIIERRGIFERINRATKVWMSHGDMVSKLPAGFSVIGKTQDCPITAMDCEEKKIYGFQFHPEVAHTKEGLKMIESFLFDICKLKKNWEVDNLVTDLEEKIRRQVGDKKVFVLASGGVDSNVTLAILSKVLGKERVLGLYIDTGFMRENESEEIKKGFLEIGFDNIKSIDASEKFFSRLRGVFDPEVKRKIIGQTFLDVKDEIAKDLNLNEKEWMLGQGTIYPDTIESAGTKNADKIKTHHNRVDAIQRLIEKGLVVEPLVEFYKDEVRELGRLLGLPEKLIGRHPFPGPGLAIRSLCQDSKAKSDNLEGIRKEVKKFFSKKFTHISYSLLPVKSVGVQGDNRTYAHPLAIWGETDWNNLAEISSAVTNSIKGVNRVILLLNPKNKNNFFPAKKDAYLTPERIENLRRVDFEVNRIVEKNSLYDKIWQFPVILLPITDEFKKESIVLRPINSRDAMTLNFFQMERDVLDEIASSIKKNGNISHIFYDITDKPPGTVEWE